MVTCISLTTRGSSESATSTWSAAPRPAAAGHWRPVSAIVSRPASLAVASPASTLPQSPVAQMPIAISPGAAR